MTTYTDIGQTEQRIELLHLEMDAPDNCAQDVALISAEIAREEKLLREQCAECGVKIRTRAEALAWWDSLPTTAEVQEGLVQL